MAKSKQKQTSQPDLSDQQIAVLQNSVITEESPGSLLHDFQVLLDFVTQEGTYLTNGLVLPMKTLQPLNDQFIRRIQHDLARTQQKSYPHINGLFLLLRGAGFTTVDTTGKKPILVVDEFVVNSWNNLNADERYFTLLESWLQSDSEVIGERGGAFRPPLFLWNTLYEHLRKSVSPRENLTELVRYWPGLHHLALMELFGLVTIEDLPVQPQKGWQVADVHPTEWGEALLALLLPQIDLGLDSMILDLFRVRQETPEQALQPIIRPYRPAWKQKLRLPAENFQDGLFVFKVGLDKDLWREIIIPGKSTLHDLSNAILKAYEFDHDHLYAFRYLTRFGATAEVHHPFMQQAPSSKKVKIGDLPAQPGFQMVFNYDFGDNWLFDVRLERIDPPNPKAPVYKIGERKGESPKQYPGLDDDDDWDDDDWDDDE